VARALGIPTKPACTKSSSTAVRTLCTAMGSQVSPQVVEDAMKRLAQQKPLIQCITNFVSMDLMANVLLAAGASPAMVSPPSLEVGDYDQQVATEALMAGIGNQPRPDACRFTASGCMSPAYSQLPGLRKHDRLHCAESERGCRRARHGFRHQQCRCTARRRWSNSSASRRLWWSTSAR